MWLLVIFPRFQLVPTSFLGGFHTRSSLGMLTLIMLAGCIIFNGLFPMLHVRLRQFETMQNKSAKIFARPFDIGIFATHRSEQRNG